MSSFETGSHNTGFASLPPDAAVTVDEAFHLRAPEAYGYGIMDDRVTSRHWTQFRRILLSELPPEFKDERYVPIDLIWPRREPLRWALCKAHDRKVEACRATIVEGLSDEAQRQSAYRTRRWPVLPSSSTERSDHFDPLSEDRVTCARRYFDCYERKFRPAVRALVAYAFLLIAIGEPVPEDVAADLADDLAEEIACLPLAEEFSGYNSWTIRSDNLRVFGSYVDPQRRHPQTDAFDHPYLTARHPGEPFNVDNPYLWRDAFGRDLDGFLLTTLGGSRIPNARLAARQSPNGMTGHEWPTLVVWENREGETEIPISFGTVTR